MWVRSNNPNQENMRYHRCVYQIEHYPEVVEKRFPRRGHTRWDWDEH